VSEEIDYQIDGPEVECWQCAGEGVIYSCFDGLCVDAEEGCDDCARRCDICRGKGGWRLSHRTTEPE